MGRPRPSVPSRPDPDEAYFRDHEEAELVILTSDSAIDDPLAPLVVGEPWARLRRPGRCCLHCQPAPARRCAPEPKWGRR